MARQSARVEFEIADIERLFESYGRLVPATVAIGLRQGVLAMVADTVLNRLTGQYLNRVTGTLIRSVTASPPEHPVVTETSVTDWFGTNLKYGAAHELGFRGRVSVRAHQVRGHKRRGRAVRAHARRAHTKQMDMRARYFLRDSLRDLTDRSKMAVGRALLVMARTGRVPSPGEVGGA